ncbi:substrate-binding domain-containing protein [Plebeiibacterium marinum]|uniref:Substrate-binding domain-containing protein n=1 Tax=Plebeiibacterium marinum TaxID=2992111 RepID=A0AAE3MAD1_9BACT|nr:substrate-binding domain-containing protein [Plebeiobacterium marinum]MCW3804191.1 substrate-binding domain-containing protein [Plebeiobacterium marinum]
MNRHIHWILQMLFVFAIILSVGCSGGSDTKKIAFLYPSETIVRFKKESQFFKAYAEKYGAEVIIKGADKDESIQKEQAQELIEQGVDAIVIIPVNVNTAASIVRNANENDIPIMTYNRMISNCEVDFFVASSNDLIGKIMVDAVMAEKQGGNFVIFGGDKFDKNGLDLQNAITKYLKPYKESGKVNVVYETFIEHWSSDIAGFEMQKVISLYGTDIDAVISGFDGMSDAVIDVLKKYDLQGKVAVTGQDAEISGCKNVIAGNQCVTVYHPLKITAEKAAEIALEMAKGKSLKDFVNSTEFNGVKEVPTHRVNSIAITKDNIDKVLIDGGVYKRDELY